MSIAVGRGFVPVQDLIEVTKGGDDANDGLTLEKPKLTIASAIAQAVSEGKGGVNVSIGTYIENIVMQDSKRLDAESSSLTSATPSTTVLEAANSSPVRLGFLSGSASNQIIYNINGKQRTLLNCDTFVMGTFFGPLPTGQTGINITGANDDIPVNILNGEVRADSSTLISFTGSSTTPPKIDLGSFTNFGDNITLMSYNPSDPLQRCTVVATWEDDVATAVTGTVLFDVQAGTLNLVSPGGVNVPGKTIAIVRNGGRFGLSDEAVSGNVEVQVGGEYQIAALGLQVGNLDLQGSGNIFQNELTGDLTIGPSAVFDGIIGKVGGTITIDPAAITAGNVNGIINGVAYGTYKNPSYSFDYGDFSNLNDGAYMVSSGVFTSPTKGPVASEDLVPESITWGEDNSNAGTLEIWSNGARWGTAVKTASNKASAVVVPDVAGSCISASENISIRWVATVGGNRMRRYIVNLNCRRC